MLISDFVYCLTGVPISITIFPPFIMSLCMKKGDSSKILSRRMLCIYLLVRELLLAIISEYFPIG